MYQGSLAGTPITTAGTSSAVPSATTATGIASVSQTPQKTDLSSIAKTTAPLTSTSSAASTTVPSISSVPTTVTATSTSVTSAPTTSTSATPASVTSEIPTAKTGTSLSTTSDSSTLIPATTVPTTSTPTTMTPATVSSMSSISSTSAPLESTPETSNILSTSTTSVTLSPSSKEAVVKDIKASTTETKPLVKEETKPAVSTEFSSTSTASKPVDSKPLSFIKETSPQPTEGPKPYQEMPKPSSEVAESKTSPPPSISSSVGLSSGILSGYGFLDTNNSHFSGADSKHACDNNNALISLDSGEDMGHKYDLEGKLTTEQTEDIADNQQSDHSISQTSTPNNLIENISGSQDDINEKETSQFEDEYEKQNVEIQINKTDLLKETNDQKTNDMQDYETNEFDHPETKQLGVYETIDFDVHVEDEFKLHETSQFDAHKINKFSANKTSNFGAYETSEFDDHESSEFDDHESNEFDVQETIKFEDHKTSEFEVHKTNEFDAHKASEFDAHETNELDDHKTSEFDAHETDEMDVYESSEFGVHKTSEFNTHKTSDFEAHESNEFNVRKTSKFGTHETNEHEFDAQETDEMDIYESSEFGVHKTSEFNTHKTNNFGAHKANEFGNQETSAFGVHKTSEFDDPQNNEFDVHKTDEFDVNKISEFNASEINELSVHEPSEFDAQENSEFDAHKSSEFDIHKNSEINTQKTSELDIQETNELDLYKASEFDLHKTNEFDAHKTNEFDASKINVLGVHETSKFSTHESSEFSSHQTGEFDAHETNEFDVHETNTFDGLETPNFDVDKTSESDSHETCEFGADESSEFDVHKTREFNSYNNLEESEVNDDDESSMPKEISNDNNISSFTYTPLKQTVGELNVIEVDEKVEKSAYVRNNELEREDYKVNLSDILDHTHYGNLVPNSGLHVEASHQIYHSNNNAEPKLNKDMFNTEVSITEQSLDVSDENSPIGEITSDEFLQDNNLDTLEELSVKNIFNETRQDSQEESKNQAKENIYESDNNNQEISSIEQLMPNAGLSLFKNQTEETIVADELDLQNDCISDKVLSDSETEDCDTYNLGLDNSNALSENGKLEEESFNLKQTETLEDKYKENTQQESYLDIVSDNNNHPTQLFISNAPEENIYSDSLQPDKIPKHFSGKNDESEIKPVQYITKENKNADLSSHTEMEHHYQIDTCVASDKDSSDDETASHLQHSLSKELNEENALHLEGGSEDTIETENIDIHDNKVTLHSLEKTNTSSKFIQDSSLDHVLKEAPEKDLTEDYHYELANNSSTEEKENSKDECFDKELMVKSQIILDTEINSLNYNNLEQKVLSGEQIFAEENNDKNFKKLANFDVPTSEEGINLDLDEDPRINYENENVSEESFEEQREANEENENINIDEPKDNIVSSNKKISFNLQHEIIKDNLSLSEFDNNFYTEETDYVLKEDEILSSESTLMMENIEGDYDTFNKTTFDDENVYNNAKSENDNQQKLMDNISNKFLEESNETNLTENQPLNSNFNQTELSINTQFTEPLTSNAFQVVEESSENKMLENNAIDIDTTENSQIVTDNLNNEFLLQDEKTSKDVINLETHSENKPYIYEPMIDAKTLVAIDQNELDTETKIVDGFTETTIEKQDITESYTMKKPIDDMDDQENKDDLKISPEEYNFSKIKENMDYNKILNDKREDTLEDNYLVRQYSNNFSLIEENYIQNKQDDICESQINNPLIQSNEGLDITLLPNTENVILNDEELTAKVADHAEHENTNILYINNSERAVKETNYTDNSDAASDNESLSSENSQILSVKNPDAYYSTIEENSNESLIVQHNLNENKADNKELPYNLKGGLTYGQENLNNDEDNLYTESDLKNDASGVIPKQLKTTQIQDGNDYTESVLAIKNGEYKSSEYKNLENNNAFERSKYNTADFTELQMRNDPTSSIGNPFNTDLSFNKIYHEANQFVPSNNYVHDNDVELESVYKKEHDTSLTPEDYDAMQQNLSNEKYNLTGFQNSQSKVLQESHEEILTSYNAHSHANSMHEFSKNDYVKDTENESSYYFDDTNNHHTKFSQNDNDGLHSTNNIANPFLDSQLSECSDENCEALNDNKLLKEQSEVEVNDATNIFNHSSNEGVLTRIEIGETTIDDYEMAEAINNDSVDSSISLTTEMSEQQKEIKNNFEININRLENNDYHKENETVSTEEYSSWDSNDSMVIHDSPSNSQNPNSENTELDFSSTIDGGRREELQKVPQREKSFVSDPIPPLSSPWHIN